MDGLPLLRDPAFKVLNRRSELDPLSGNLPEIRKDLPAHLVQKLLFCRLRSCRRYGVLHLPTVPGRSALRPHGAQAIHLLLCQHQGASGLRDELIRTVEESLLREYLARKLLNELRVTSDDFPEAFHRSRHAVFFGHPLHLCKRCVELIETPGGKLQLMQPARGLRIRAAIARGDQEGEEDHDNQLREQDVETDVGTPGSGRNSRPEERRADINHAAARPVAGFPLSLQVL